MLSALCWLAVVQKTRQVIVFLIGTNTETFADKVKGSNNKCGVVWWHQRTCSDMLWCVAHISKIHVIFFIYVYLCQVHCSYAILGHDCCWKTDPKIDDDLCVRRRAKWFSAHVLYQVPFSCLSSTWEMYSMHPGYCSQIYVTSQKPLLAAICDCFYQAEWVIYCMHFGRMSSCNNVFWGRDLSQHVYDLWAVKHQTLRPGLHYSTQCPLCVRKSQPLLRHCHWVG